MSLLAKSDAGGASSTKGVIAMIEKVLSIVAAMATIAGFILEVWRETKARADGRGKEKDGL